MEMVNKQIDMLAAAIEKYKMKVKNYSLGLTGENYQLQRKVEELIEKYEHLHSNHTQQGQRQEDEIKMLQSQIAAKELQHKAQLEEVKRDYNKQISDKLSLVHQLEKEMEELKRKVTTTGMTEFVHPICYEENKNIKKISKARQKTLSSAFKWPELDVKKTHNQNNSSHTELNKKRRKLYHAEEEPVDLIS